MQRLDAAIHHFRESRVLGNIEDRDTRGFEGFTSPSCGQQFESQTNKPLGKGNQTMFIAETNQRTTRTDWHGNNFRGTVIKTRSFLSGHKNRLREF